MSRKRIFSMSDNSDFTTLASWDGGGTTSTTTYTWYSSDDYNANVEPKSYTFGNQLADTGGDDTTQYKGALYNWVVATAGKGDYSTSPLITIEDSICPKGWRLPLGGTEDIDKSWYKLIPYLNGDSSQVQQFIDPPYSFIRVGLIHSDPRNNGAIMYTDRGTWWSSTKHSFGAYVYMPFVGSGFVRAANTDPATWGASIRCINR